MTNHFNLLDPLVRRAIKNGQNPDVARKWERNWYNVDQAKQQLRMVDTAPSGSLSSQDKRLQQLLRHMLLDEKQTSRPVGMPTHPGPLQALKTSHPNFAEVVDHVLAQQALMRTRHALPRRLQPMLLLGNPGIGKTSFVQALAAAMQVSQRTVAMNNATAGFLLAGLDRGWATGKEGLVFSLLQQSSTLNPLVLLDEVDKALSNEKTEPLAPLYQLLEVHTARQFRDEFLDVELNASFITWVASANGTEKVPAPLLDRFRVFEIEAPNAAQMATLARNQYAALREDVPALAATLRDDILHALGQRSPRDCQAALQAAAGHAALRAAATGSAQVCLLPEDLPPAMACTRSMGFV